MFKISITPRSLTLFLLVVVILISRVDGTPAIASPIKSNTKKPAIAAMEKKRQNFKLRLCKKIQKKYQKAGKTFRCAAIKAAALAPVFYAHVYDTTSNNRKSGFPDGGSFSTGETICLHVNDISKVVFHTDSQTFVRNFDYNLWLPICMSGSIGSDIQPSNVPLGRHTLTMDFYNQAGNFVGWHDSSFTVVSGNNNFPLEVATRTPTPTITSTPTATMTSTPTALPMTRSGVGINLESVKTYSSQLPFKNLFLQTSGWSNNALTNISQYLDSEGWPVWIPSGQTLRAPLISDMPLYPGGRYMLRFQGSGDVRVTGDVYNFTCSKGQCEFDVIPSNNGLAVEVRSVQQTIKKIEVFEKRFDGTLLSSPFHPNFLATLGPKPRALRFMDWFATVDPHPETNSRFTGGTLPKIAYAYGNTVVLAESGAPLSRDLKKAIFILRPATGANPRFVVSNYDPVSRSITLNGSVTSAFQPGTDYEIFSFRNREWSERPTITGVPKEDSGVALELMIQLANQTKASPWFNIPVTASDDYVQQMATLVKNTLDPSLEVYIEYANEFWNYEYPGNMGFLWGQANQATTGVGSSQYYSLRSVQIFDIWNQVFGARNLRSERGTPDRLRRIIGSQTENFYGIDVNGNGTLAQDEYFGTGPQLLQFGGEGLLPGISNPYVNGKKTYDYADAVGLTFYFNGLKENDLDDLNSGAASSDTLINKLFSEVDHMVNVNPADASSGILPRWVTYARNYGLDIQGYEGSLVLNLDAGIPTFMGMVTSTSEGNAIGLDPWKIGAGNVASLPGRYIEILSGTNLGEIRKILSVTSNDYERAMVQIDNGFSSPVMKGAVYKLMTPRHLAQEKLSMHPRMKDLYKYFLGSWRGLGKVNGVGAEVLNQFTNTGRWMWHYLSLVERVDIDPMYYPKFRGYAEFQRDDVLE